ncbi:cryptochrome/photolyase family protein [Salisaeta longa]|uniref:cryptochrome/photolyase family protein n=1 Tax=Salisaeta longa TaxID=503170 RepID=UPI0003B2F945|nr:deoxyribodipyrimidine photo-lyase [Salisaeta longa]
MPAPTLVWFRHDLRLADHAALHAAADDGPVVPVFVWNPDAEGTAAPGGAARWWLHHALAALDASLRDRGGALVLRQGDAATALTDAARAVGATRVVWNRRYAPPLAAQANRVADALRDEGLTVDHHFTGRLMHDPEGVETTSGGPYHVYTPFWKKVTGHDLLDTRPPLDAPALAFPDALPASEPLEALQLLPEARDGVDWAGGLREAWTPGEDAAHERLQETLDRIVADYETMRNRPDKDGTSRLSPHLHHGALSPRQVWHAVTAWAETHDARAAAEPFLQELVWREFSYHWLYHYPNTPTETYRDKFKDFAWVDDADALTRWQNGRTGFPIVDAGMRQLYETGWMHNRVRMIVASFLTKDLLIHWRHGARWFWDTLVDGDLASNTMGWQWSAGSGVDAQPFFRIFNPVSQSERYDPNGDYIRRFVPELSDVPTEHLHAPWEAPSDVLTNAGVTLGDTYPDPMVDHSVARENALDAYDDIR